VIKLKVPGLYKFIFRDRENERIIINSTRALCEVSDNFYNLVDRELVNIQYKESRTLFVFSNILKVYFFQAESGKWLFNIFNLSDKRESFVFFIGAHNLNGPAFIYKTSEYYIINMQIISKKNFKKKIAEFKMSKE